MISKVINQLQQLINRQIKVINQVNYDAVN